jgi:hypothetical protein
MVYMGWLRCDPSKIMGILTMGIQKIHDWLINSPPTLASYPKFWPHLKVLYISVMDHSPIFVPPNHIRAVMKTLCRPFVPVEWSGFPIVYCDKPKYHQLTGVLKHVHSFMVLLWCCGDNIVIVRNSPTIHSSDVRECAQQLRVQIGCQRMSTAQKCHQIWGRYSGKIFHTALF